MKYSEKTGCFYPESIIYSDLPDDLIEVADADYQSAMSRPTGATLAVQAGKLAIVQAVPPDPAVVAKQAKAAARNAAMTAGELYADTGVTIPFTKDDAAGLLQVQAEFQAGVQSTNIRFSNGQQLPMTPLQFPAFSAWFFAQRSSFFK